jgi:hypothetical protein
MTTKYILFLIGFLGVMYLMLNLYAFMVSDNLLFVPREPGYTHLPDEFKIVTGDGEQITAVFLENPEAEYTILFSHGNAEDLGLVVPFMQQFHDCGYSVLMYDYRGYGTSDGEPSTVHAKEDVTAAYHWLVDTKKINPKKIISQGRSLGGAVAVWLAARHEVGGLITEISFTSAIRVKTRWKVLPWDKFNSLKSIRRVHCPVLVIHGTDDMKIPIWHGQKVYEAAREPKRHLWIEGGRHSTYAYVAEEAYINTIQRFVDELLD